MTKGEAIEYGIRIMAIFPNDISANEVHWVLKNLLESSSEVSEEIAQQVDSSDAKSRVCTCEFNVDCNQRGWKDICSLKPHR